MRIALVNPPIHHLDADQVYPPLGLMCLAEQALERGHKARIFDLNLQCCAGTAPDDPSSFYEEYSQNIAAWDPDVLVVTSMGLNSHVGILLAEAIKSVKRNVYVVAGGPDFSAAPVEFLKRFPAIDAVASTASGSSGILCGNRINGKVSSDGIAACSLNLFAEGSSGRLQGHPWKSYSLIDLDSYFELQREPRVCYETSRGCKYNCTFCYSKKLWGKPTVEATPGEVVGDFRKLRKLGCNSVFIVGDNFVNSRESAARISRALRKEHLDLTWTCYATLPDVDSNLVEEMARGGCVGMFMGLDAVTLLQALKYRKHFVRLNEDSEIAYRKAKALELIEGETREWVQLGVRPTYAFVIDVAYDTKSELHQTLLMAARLCHAGAGLRFNSLCLYNGTPLARRHSKSPRWYSETRLRVVEDTPPVVVENPLARGCKELFPFHNRLIAESAWEKRLLALHAAQVLVKAFPSTMVRLAESGLDLWEVAERVVKKYDTELWYADPFRRKATARRLFQELYMKTSFQDGGRDESSKREAAREFAADAQHE